MGVSPATWDHVNSNPLSLLLHRLQRLIRTKGAFPNYFGSQRIGGILSGDNTCSDIGDSTEDKEGNDSVDKIVDEQDEIVENSQESVHNDTFSDKVGYNMTGGPLIGKLMLTGQYEEALWLIIMGEDRKCWLTREIFSNSSGNTSNGTVVFE